MIESPPLAVEFDNVTLTYVDAAEPALREVNLHLESGELVVVVGRTGSGKSTLLGAINGLVPHFTGGTLRGRVRVAGRDTETHRPRDLATVVGVVGQDPAAGFVTDTVEEELAYGMEQLGLSAETMRRRVEETLDLMGIADLRDRPLRELSGGQQQRVAIGSVLTAHPSVLVLDEPTSALDPTGAEEVLATITRLVHDLGVTVILAEHRIERVLQYADRIVHIADGQAVAGPPEEVISGSTVAPPVVELGRLLGWSPLPLSVRDAQRRARSAQMEPRPRSRRAPGPVALQANGICVNYGTTRAVADVTVSLAAGTVTALMGRNGCGKSSLLWALQGSGPRRSGEVMVDGADPHALSAKQRRARVGLVPQTPSDLLYLPTVAQECVAADREAEATVGTCRELLDQIAPGIDPDLHPRDLSEGQRLALVLAIQLSARPPVLLLDEPTRGLDYTAKRTLAEILGGLDQTAVLLSTHDVEFVAAVADRVIVMAQGEIVADGPIDEVVTSSPAYAPQVSKVLGAGFLTVDDVRRALV
ncbi:MAG TPA: ATP-binding cassette domain-containing protein [Marmoricola sp.]|mgnify:CR=1 FL=1|nr:ATP-binding cassette domain-containing protein [Marmoricola sp.]